MLADSNDQTLMEVREAFCLVQSWLFFGYIHEAFRILGLPLTQSEFLDPARKDVSTRMLKTYFARIRNRRSHPAEAKLAEFHKNLLFVLAKHHEREQQIHTTTARSDGWIIQPLFLLSELNISIVSVAEEFKMLLRDSPVKPTTGDSIRPISRTHDAIDIRNLFPSVGWCEDMATRIIRTYTFETSYYLYMLGPPRSEFHHGNCINQVCHRSIIDESNYVICHENLTDSECGTCTQTLSRALPLLASTLTSDSLIRSLLRPGDTRHMPGKPPIVVKSNPAPMLDLRAWGPSASELEDILLHDDKFPVIVIESNPRSTKALKFRVVAHDSPECFGYVAFSHVWSHGRDNPSSNSLPLCQLVRLARLASRVLQNKKGYGAFWIDTLCVPATSPWARKKAILQMREVYTKAESTIVIVETLERSTRSASSLETLGMLTLLGWTTRFWTVRESVLSRRVQVLFDQDELVDLKSTIRSASYLQYSAVITDYQLHGGIARLSGDLGLYIGCLRPSFISLHDRQRATEARTARQRKPRKFHNSFPPSPN